VTSSRYLGVAYFANARELLRPPGQFVYDSADRTVSYLPLPGQDMRRAEAVAPAAERLVTVEPGAHDLVLRGLALEHTAWDQPSGPDGYAGTQAGLTLTGATGPKDQSGQYYTKPAAALTVSGGRHITVQDCRFSGLGGAGAVLQDGTTGSAVTGSRFTGVSSGAVYVGDTDPHPAAGARDQGNTVSYDTITGIGAEFTDAVGIWAGYTEGLTVAHNTLEDLPYSGISVGWGWNQPQAQNPWLGGNTISGNRIIDVMRPMSPAVGQHDGGAIYTQGQQPGTVISGNYIDRTGTDNGVYLDEESSHIHVTGNVVTRTGVKWLSNWASYGVDNHADHNWTDSTTTPPLSGTGSTMTDDWTGLTWLPADAVAVAEAAGAGPWPAPVDQLGVG
jgi:beta-glucuronidase